MKMPFFHQGGRNLRKGTLGLRTRGEKKKGVGTGRQLTKASVHVGVISDSPSVNITRWKRRGRGIDLRGRFPITRRSFRKVTSSKNRALGARRGGMKSAMGLRFGKAEEEAMVRKKNSGLPTKGVVSDLVSNGGGKGKKRRTSGGGSGRRLIWRVRGVFQERGKTKK